jgi:ribosomal protein L40E
MECSQDGLGLGYSAARRCAYQFAGDQKQLDLERTMPLRLICSKCHARNDADADRCSSCGTNLRTNREITADELVAQTTGVIWEPSWEEYKRLEGLAERLSREAKWTGVVSMFGFESSTILGGFLALRYFSERRNAVRFAEMLEDYRRLLQWKNSQVGNSYYRELHRFRQKWSQATGSF